MIHIIHNNSNNSYSFYSFQSRIKAPFLYDETLASYLIIGASILLVSAKILKSILKSAGCNRRLLTSETQTSTNGCNLDSTNGFVQVPVASEKVSPRKTSKVGKRQEPKLRPSNHNLYA